MNDVTVETLSHIHWCDCKWVINCWARSFVGSGIVNNMKFPNVLIKSTELHEMDENVLVNVHPDDETLVVGNPASTPKNGDKTIG